MCLLHKWSKWRPYNHEYRIVAGLLAPKSVQGQIFDTQDLRQCRTCVKCGKIQDVLVAKGVSLE